MVALDGPQVVDAHEHDRQRPVVAAGARDLLDELLVERLQREQARQAVVAPSQLAFEVCDALAERRHLDGELVSFPSRRHMSFFIGTSAKRPDAIARDWTIGS